MDSSLELYEIADKVKTKDDLVIFLTALADDLKKNKDEWENQSLYQYIEAISSWLESMEIVYENADLEFPDNPSWSTIADIFYVGKIYE